MTTEPLLLTTAEASKVLSLGESTLRQLLANGTIESIAIGRSRRIPMSVLVAYIETLRREQGLDSC